MRNVDETADAICDAKFDALPERVQEALGELAGAAKEGLLALSVGVGLGVLSELMAEEVDDVVGPRGRHDPGRSAVRHGSESGQLTLGGRRVPVERPRVRATDGSGEVQIASYAHFADRDPLTKVVLERSQLHRILSTETWVFGEEYHLVADDESLTNVLRRHLAYLERDELAAEKVTDEHGRTRIVDLMLARSLEHAANRREHLVVELKRPSVRIGHTEVAQIRDYAQAVADDAQFDKATTQWDFWIVSTEMDDAIKRQANQRNREPGLLDDYDEVNVRIWAKTWGQIIQDATHRLKFVRQQLEYTSARDQAIQYLHERHREYVPAPLQLVEPLADDAVGGPRPASPRTASVEPDPAS